MTRALAPPALLLLALPLAACAPTVASGVRARPGEAEGRVAYYADDNELEVSTFTARVEQPLSERSSIFVRGIADHVVLTPKPLHAPHASPGQPTGHRDADVVTSASSTAGEAAGADEWRVEVLGGGEVGFDVADAPATVRAHARVSQEADYASYSGVARGTVEVAERNATLAAFAGFGHDEITPLEAPPGDEDEWPASHQRVVLGGSLSQIVSPSLVLGVGAGTTWQHGQLSSPYRNAVVVTTLFPESLPDERVRFTGSTTGAWSFAPATALHLSLGGYVDSWEVLGFVPSAEIVRELGDHGLASLRYRFVSQSAASFYEVTYGSRLDVMAGDARLGDLHEHAGGVSLAWTAAGDRGDFGSVTVILDEEVSTLTYEGIGLDVFATISTLGVELGY